MKLLITFILMISTIAVAQDITYRLTAMTDYGNSSVDTSTEDGFKAVRNFLAEPHKAHRRLQHSVILQSKQERSASDILFKGNLELKAFIESIDTENFSISKDPKIKKLLADYSREIVLNYIFTDSNEKVYLSASDKNGSNEIEKNFEFLGSARHSRLLTHVLHLRLEKYKGLITLEAKEIQAEEFKLDDGFSSNDRLNINDTSRTNNKDIIKPSQLGSTNYSRVEEV